MQLASHEKLKPFNLWFLHSNQSNSTTLIPIDLDISLYEICYFAANSKHLMSSFVVSCTFYFTV